MHWVPSNCPKRRCDLAAAAIVVADDLAVVVVGLLMAEGMAELIAFRMTMTLVRPEDQG